MASFLMSAKNGDQVNKAFWKIASTLAGKAFAPELCSVIHREITITVSCAVGVSINKTDLESKGAVVPAQIIDHQRLVPPLPPWPHPLPLSLS
jgi:hypothetical protein